MKRFKTRKIVDIPYQFKKKNQKSRWLFWTVYAALAAMIGGTLILTIAIIILNSYLPSMEDLKKISITESTHILDRNEELLYSIHGEENREYVPLKEISQSLVNATIAIEDDEFYTHPGFDIPAIMKAVFNEVTGIGQRRGGSTITQQFVKNYFLSREKTYTRKLKELILAIKIEKALSKNDILELYLNKIPYGNNAYGIQQAANIYFKKDAKDLTIAESAILASLPQAPSYYSPYGPRRYSTLDHEFTVDELKASPIKSMNDLDESDYTRGLLGKTYALADGSEIDIIGRSDLVLFRMKELGYINNEEYKNAQDEIRNAIEFTPHRQTIVAPHFVFYVRDYLEKKYGKEIVEQGGLRVITTLDSDLQKTAEDIVEKQAEFNAENYKATNAALLAMDPQTGHILAMVGSANYFDSEISGQVNITTRPLQPGSSFKPFVYAGAFLNQYSPASVVYDVATKFGTSTQEIQNFDGKFMGPLSLREGLAYSRNIPAIKALYLAGGERSVVGIAKEFGMDSLKDDGSYGISLALGTGPVTMTELLSGYSVFANGGYKIVPIPILRIENSKGEILEEWIQPEEGDKKQVLDEQIAYLINNVLSDPEIHLGQRLRVAGHTVAAKTGTANKKLKNGNILPSNAWTVGYTPEIVVGAWSGNSDGSEMSAKASGYNNASPIFNQFMTYFLKERKDVPFKIPQGIKHVTVSTTSGLLPSSDTPDDKVKSEVFASFGVPTLQDDTLYTIKIDSMTKKLATEYTPKHLVEEKTLWSHKSIIDNPQWQEGINTYVANKHLEEPENTDYQPIPTETDNLHKPEYEANGPHIEILSPQNFNSVAAGEITVKTSVVAPQKVDKVEYLLNDRLQYTRYEAPFTGFLRVNKATPSGTVLKIKVRVLDNFGYMDEKEIDVRIE